MHGEGRVSKARSNDTDRTAIFLGGVIEQLQDEIVWTLSVETEW